MLPLTLLLLQMYPCTRIWITLMLNVTLLFVPALPPVHQVTLSTPACFSFLPLAPTVQWIQSEKSKWKSKKSHTQKSLYLSFLLLHVTSTYNQQLFNHRKSIRDPLCACHQHWWLLVCDGGWIFFHPISHNSSHTIVHLLSNSEKFLCECECYISHWSYCEQCHLSGIEGTRTNC